MHSDQEGRHRVAADSLVILRREPVVFDRAPEPVPHEQKMAAGLLALRREFVVFDRAPEPVPHEQKMAAPNPTPAVPPAASKAESRSTADQMPMVPPAVVQTQSPAALEVAAKLVQWAQDQARNHKSSNVRIRNALVRVGLLNFRCACGLTFKHSFTFSRHVSTATASGLNGHWKTTRQRRDRSDLVDAVARDIVEGSPFLTDEGRALIAEFGGAEFLQS